MSRRTERVMQFPRLNFISIAFDGFGTRLGTRFAVVSTRPIVPTRALYSLEKISLVRCTWSIRIFNYLYEHINWVKITFSKRIRRLGEWYPGKRYPFSSLCFQLFDKAVSFWWVNRSLDVSINWNYQSEEARFEPNPGGQTPKKKQLFFRLSTTLSWAFVRGRTEVLVFWALIWSERGVGSPGWELAYLLNQNCGPDGFFTVLFFPKKNVYISFETYTGYLPLFFRSVIN